MKLNLPTDDPPLGLYQFWVTPANGNSRHLADTTEFYNGCSMRDLRKKEQRLWRGDFRGNPGLAEDFVKVVQALRHDEENFKRLRYSWRNFYRFIQERTDLPPVNSIHDITRVHGVALKQWLHARGLSSGGYRPIKAIVDAFFMMERHRPSDLPARDGDAKVEPEEQDLIGLQRLSLVLRGEARAQKQMIREGNELADLGRDPRRRLSRWNSISNQVWLVRELTTDFIPTKPEIIKAGATNLRDRSFGGPSYRSPGQSARATQGYVGKLRYFAPAQADTAVYLWLFMLHTGFNLATTVDIDISNDQWFQTSFQDPSHVLISIFKKRSGTWVFAPSLVQPEFHPFQLIQFMIKRTEKLRKTLQLRLGRLQEHDANFPTNTVKAEITYVQRLIKSPWLYHNIGDAGHVEGFQSSDAGLLNRFIRNVVHAEELNIEHPWLSGLATTQVRDGMINFAHDRSGSAMIAQYAAQHRSQRSLRYYLAKGQQRKKNFKAVNQIISLMIKEALNKNIIDFVRIRIMRERGEITAVQEQRLLDIRQRTRVGMGCLEPTNPPRHIAPDHTPDTICKIQRCTGCCHGIIFDDSVKPLSCALADLHYIKRDLPLSSWIDTSLADEEASIKATLKQFSPEVVKGHYTDRFNELLSGKAKVFDVYPLY
ncbi:hypothetical protein [Rhizobium laguerreae]|uniref:hypothetical protein n=1 Tax=Rhizobium laguerreae TaxID=1076926 RepID=UPI0014421334|nr:hypothetical protein [Rhizobium laguerreae]NKM69418.1 hypothetical protein [Rhizobium laguerreae]